MTEVHDSAAEAPFGNEFEVQAPVNGKGWLAASHGGGAPQWRNVTCSSMSNAHMPIYVRFGVSSRNYSMAIGLMGDPAALTSGRGEMTTKNS